MISYCTNVLLLIISRKAKSRMFLFSHTENKMCRALRLLRGFARFVSRLSALRGWSTQVQPLGEGDRLHPEELWEPDGAALTEGRAGHTHTHIDKSEIQICKLDEKTVTKFEGS